MNAMHNNTPDKGFTLLELGAVLVIVGIVAAMGIPAGLSALENARRVATERKMAEIEKALFKFRDLHDRLPCPALSNIASGSTGYGEEASRPGRCVDGTLSLELSKGDLAGAGTIPYTVLGRPEEYMYDGWGRRFQYEVVTTLTWPGSFSVSRNGNMCTADGAITIKTENGSDTYYSGPAYVLYSFGANGVGGYRRDGTQVTGTAGTHEATANRALNDDPYYVYKSGVRGSPGNSDYYDDILRFKTRAQLMNESDRLRRPIYGPDMVAGEEGGATNGWAAQNIACGSFVDVSSTFSAPSSEYKYANFTPSNAELFVYGNNSCSLHKITAVGFKEIFGGVPNCPSGSTVFAMAGNGLLITNLTSSPYIRVWKYVQESGTGYYTELPNALSPALSATPDHITASDDGNYISVSSISSGYTRLYMFDGERYRQQTAAPFSTNYRINAIAPNGQYYAVVDASASPHVLRLWRNVNNSFQALSGTLTLTDVDQSETISFSGTSNTLAILENGSSAVVTTVSINPLLDSISGQFNTNLVTAYNADTVLRASFFPNDWYVIFATGIATNTTGYLAYRKGTSISEPYLSTQYTNTNSFIDLSDASANSRFVTFRR